MKTYPSIDTEINQDLTVHIFAKYDGSNIRAEWSKKKGFYKFGTRKRLFDETDSLFSEAKTLILEKEKHLIERLPKRCDSAVFFFEFFGPNSLAGIHLAEPHEVCLIDVSVYKQGMMAPKEFCSTFGDLDFCARLLGIEKVDEWLEEEIRSRKLFNETLEGVVCKGLDRKGQLEMFKIKTYDWLELIKKKYADRKEMLEELI